MFTNTDGYIGVDETEDKWKRALDAVGDGMWDFSFTTKKIFFSRKWHEMFGYDAEDLADDPTLWSNKVHPDDLVLSSVAMDEYLKGGKPSYRAEIRYQCKSGEYKWVLSRGVVIAWDENGHPLRMIGTHQDIQERKMAEEAMKLSNRQLEMTRIKMEDKIKRLEELNNLIAHNLRGPAGNIKMLAAVLQEIEDGTNATPMFTRPQAISMIIDVNNAFLADLNTLLEAAQVSLNSNVNHEPIDVLSIIDHVSGQLSAEIHEKKAVIETNIEVAAIPCPKAYLSSICYNLLSNALKYIGPETIPHIHISVVKEGSEIILSVKDNGLGLDLKKYGHKIFKLNKVFHAGFDSRGVGLYMTRAQVESLGGRITVESVPNEGSLFTVFFPADPQKVI